MTPREIATLLSYVIVGLFGVALVMFAISLRLLRRGRRGPYWRLRRQASQRGGVLFLASVGLFVIALVLALYSGLAAVAYRGVDEFFRRGDGLVGVVVPTETPTLNVTETATPAPTLTMIPTIVPTVTTVPTSTVTPTANPTITQTSTATFTATDTQTPTATLTPSATVDSVLNLTPPAPGIPARASASIRITAADALISPARQPLEPRTTFTAGIERIYLFITFEDMDDGVDWARVLYRDGQPVQGQAYIWGQGESGQSFFFFGNEAGYPPGAYEVRVYLGAEEISRFLFTVVE